MSLYQDQRNVKNPYPVFIYGDWEYYSKIIKLSGQTTNIVPVLAAWHYLWHLLKAIFILHGDWLLLPIATKLMYRRVNATADNYHACCGYLISLTKAAIDIIEQNKKDVDVMKHFSDTKDNAVMYL